VSEDRVPDHDHAGVQGNAGTGFVCVSTWPRPISQHVQRVADRTAGVTCTPTGAPGHTCVDWAPDAADAAREVPWSAHQPLAWRCML
jgi:hypothetical protein